MNRVRWHWFESDTDSSHEIIHDQAEVGGGGFGVCKRNKWEEDAK